jgi:hypothetical protein
MATWVSVWREQLARINASRLLETANVTGVFYSESTDPANMPSSDDKRLMYEYGGLPSQREFPTLRRLQQYCLEVREGDVCVCVRVRSCADLRICAHVWIGVSIDMDVSRQKLVSGVMLLPHHSVCGFIPPCARSPRHVSSTSTPR